ncbi:TonB-dependent receptor [Bacteroides sp. AM10-21B]|uniref:TonB-dependent receptor n=1 Tax=Bacteroides sp. AM10-21B TaxID=2292001 RepID=UPI000E539D8A|nr:TonB-dependent receptor [Bacteroides sp. AM10-21B]RHJ51632.1 SusC/RagA family TonB-linked outer membrane protein [Bacteroides sp. AM10-21B]
MNILPNSKRKSRNVYSFLAFLLFVCLSFVPYSVQAQNQNNITLSVQNETVENVFNQLSKQTGLKFFYDETVINNVSRVSLSVKDASLQSVLDKISSQTKLYFNRENNTISVGKQKNSNTGKQVKTKTITGRVVDQTGEPIIGASVVVKGTTNGIITDVDGNYTLSDVPEEGTISFSYIGYKTAEFKADNRDLAKIILKEDNELLDEVVVVGYGVQRKRDVTTSISSMKASELAVPVSSVDQALVGKMTGVQVTQPNGVPGGGLSIKVRGSGSITAGTDPLYVIDGFPMSSDAGNGAGQSVSPLSTINMNDIESIEVLKDASAAAIYGSRGANGVVIITTKKGKEGKDLKPTVQYDGYVGFQQRTKKIDMLDAYDYAKLSYDGHNNAYLDLLESKGIQGSITDTNDERNAKLGKKPGTINQAYLLPPEIMPYINGETGLTNTDWQDEVMRTALTHSHNLSLSGGNSSTRYFISGNYMKEEGIVIGSEFEQMGARGKVDTSYKRFAFGANLSFNYSVYDIVPTEDRYKNETIVASALAMAPIMPVYNPDGSYNFDQWNWQYKHPQIVNPVALANEKEDQMKRYRFLGNVYGEYELYKDLKFKTSFGVDFNSYSRSYYRPSTLPTSLNRVPPSVPEGSKRDKNLLNWVWENTLSYVKTFKQDHHLSAVAGWSAQKESANTSLIAGNGYPNDLVHTINAASAITNWSATAYEWSLLSALARAQYSYKGKYMLSAAIRADGSSRFGKNNRWGTFPSVSAGWYVSEEDFMKSLHWLSSLKLRASYGVSGNFNIGNYDYYATLSEDNYAYGKNDGTLANGLYPSTAGNPDLGWEKTAMLNLGLEFGLFNMFTFELDWYTSTTSDMLLDVPVAEFSGFSTIPMNIGKVSNKGIEFSLATTNKWGDFTWNNRFNISANRNKVVDLGGVDEMLTTTESVTFITKVGEPIGNYYTLVTDGVFANQAEIDNSKDPDKTKRKYAYVKGAKPGDFRYKDVDGSGEIDENDRTITGNYMPKFTYGFSTEMKYKNIDLAVSLQGVQGNKIANIFRRYIDNMEGGNNCQVDALDRWVSESNPGSGLVVRANRSATGMNGTTSTWHIEDGSYLRIKNITLGYTLPKSWLSNVGINHLRVYLSTQNPFTFTKYSGYNPEVNMKGNSLTPGIDYGTYPLAKSFVFGLNVTF